jgi:threonine/homoserine/homoserine lactone efflux protein
MVDQLTIDDLRKLSISEIYHKVKISNETLSDIINVKHWGYFFEGFLVEFLNPLAFTFFISIMTIIISPQEFWGTKIAYWVEIIVLGSIWFLTVENSSSQLH